jgi:hypothetical protein
MIAAQEILRRLPGPVGRAGKGYAASAGVSGAFAFLVASVLALYVIAYPLAKTLEAPALVLAAAAAALACLFYGRVITSRAYLAFAALSLVLLLVSLAGYMPDAWTLYRDDVAAIRQWIWVPLLPVATTAFVLVFRQARGTLNTAPLFCLVAIGAAIFSIRLGVYGVGSAESSGIYTLTGNNAAVLLPFAIWLFRNNARASVSLVGIAVLALFSNSAQSQLFALCLLLLWLTRGHGLVLIGLVASIFALLAAAPFFPYLLHQIDPNTGLRALFWRDTLDALGQSFGLGVGYGTEFVRSDFTELKHMAWSLAEEGDAGRLHISTHSTLYDIALRNGFAGVLLFLVWFFEQVSGRGVAIRDRGLFASMGALFAVSSLVNPGLSSINFLFASAMCLAVMIIIRRDGWYETRRAGA